LRLNLAFSYIGSVRPLLHGTRGLASAKLCGVQQKAPPIFGRVASRWASAHILVFFLSAVTFVTNICNVTTHP